jgi:crotonobetainyl-CoA:carnitine CoA-transferase CaiB-like acyl-CoA transferase
MVLTLGTKWGAGKPEIAIPKVSLYDATLTALFERERTGWGRLVEVAMQEAAYATLTSQLHAYFETGQVPLRTGNASHGPRATERLPDQWP